jgi:hypothetical protein
MRGDKLFPERRLGRCGLQRPNGTNLQMPVTSMLLLK